MFTSTPGNPIHPLLLPTPDQLQLSRQAADRYALRQAVAERRLSRRRPSLVLQLFRRRRRSADRPHPAASGLNRGGGGRVAG